MAAHWFEQFKANQLLPADYYDNFCKVAQTVYDQVTMSSSTPYFIGLNGCQGSGKSTLVLFIQEYLKAEHGIQTVVASLDDFYYSQEKRQALAQEIHPLLQTRGVPGTHDTPLLADVLHSLKLKRPVDIPVFDKSLDTPLPRSLWQHITTAPDVFIFEGWCWGVNAQGSQLLDEPANEFERLKDPDGAWRTFVNQSLLENYEPLYSAFNFWIYLKAPSFNNVLAWRTEQEHKLKARIGKDMKNTKGVMSDKQIKNFISFFQRLTEEGFRQMPSKSNVNILLDDKRHVKEILIQ